MNTAWSKPTKYVVGVGLALLGAYVLYLSRSVIPLLVVAALIAMIVRPVISWLRHALRLPRGLAVALVYLSLLIIVPLALLLAVPALINALEYVVSLDYVSIFQDSLEWLESTLLAIQDAQLPVDALDSYVDELIDAVLAELEQVAVIPEMEPPPVGTILQFLGAALLATFDAAAGLVGAVLSRIALLIFIFLASIYISLGAHTYRSTFLGVVPPAYRPEIDVLLTRIMRMWNAYFRGQLTLMLFVGVMVWLGLVALGVPGAPYLGIIAGLLEILPGLGPILSGIPAVIVALLQGSAHLQVSPVVLAGLVILFYVLVQQIENNLIVPRVLGGAVGLPALVVIAGLLVGASVAGILGALVVTPVIASAREILRYAYRKLLGEDPFPPEEMLAEPPARSSMELRRRLRAWVRRLGRLRAPAPQPPDPDAAGNPEREPEV